MLGAMPRSSRVTGNYGAQTFALLAACLLPALGVAQTLEPSRIDVSELGPQIGEIVPDFSLPDQNGNTFTRASIMGPKGAMLVFIRSADW